jgi:hypothetical protein
VPRPGALLARRRGGSNGSRWGVLFFCGVLIEFVGLEGRSLHQIGRCTLAQVRLDPLAQRMQLLTRQAEFARQTRGRFAFGDAAEQENQGRGRLAGFFERRAGQQGVVAIAVATAVGRKVFLLPKEAAISAPTAGADEAIRVEVALQPDHADAGIEQLGNRKINHTAMIPRCTLPTHEPKRRNNGSSSWEILLPRPRARPRQGQRLHHAKRLQDKS